MGCAQSKKNEELNDVVSLCKERKRLLKKAIEYRYALADAQLKYNHSLYAVSASLRLFIARHSSPSSQFLITFSETTETSVPKPLFVQNRATEPTHETINPCSLKLCTKNEEKGGVSESEEDEDEKKVCEHFYGDNPTPISPSQRDFGWDFFYPFNSGVKTEEVNGFNGDSDEDLRLIREEEGIPELEKDRDGILSEEKIRVENSGDVGHEEGGGGLSVKKEEENGLFVIDSANSGRELLEALKDVEDQFLKAYGSGMEVSSMLETKMVQVQSALEEIKENSNKLVRSITRSRSTSSTLSWSSSCKSLLTVTSSSRASSTRSDFKNELFDEYGGMEYGRHSLTLGRLYAWEKKLYQEVKVILQKIARFRAELSVVCAQSRAFHGYYVATDIVVLWLSKSGEEAKKIYKRKCSLLRGQDAKGEDPRSTSMDKTGVDVRELHSKILVSIRSVESISERIQKLRDEELQPQLVELLHGLMRNWKTMLESHESQRLLMYEVNSFNCPTYAKFCNNLHRLATLQLEAELRNWHSCFVAYSSSQKAYIEALSNWLSKFVAPETDLYLNRKYQLTLGRINGPPLLVMCHDWLVCLDNLPYKVVTSAMKSFRKEIHALLDQQEQEQQQKRKVDGLAKELDKKVLAFQKAERKILESKNPEQEMELHIRSRIEYLTEQKGQLDMLRKRLEEEKLKHHTSMKDTQLITVSGFQIGFSSVFESLSEFSKAVVKMYTDLLTFSENSRVDEKVSKPSVTV